MVNTSDFPKRLQKILDYYGVSATAFSEEMGFNRSTISHLLSGRNKPSLEFVMKVLQQYPEVELYWLLDGKGSFPSDQIPKGIPIQKTENETPLPIPNLFSEEKIKKPEKTIERIVIFYEDGSFKAYEN
jgi:transcriptional regulator with XRE-family HTH domain